MKNKTNGSIKLTQPYPLQHDILDHTARFKVVVCGRRFGKTELGKIVVGNVVLDEKEQVVWFSPTYQMASQIWRELKATFSPIIKWKSEQDKIMEFHGGGELRIFSAEKFDRVRGIKPKTIIFDEAAMMTNGDIWYAASRPSLADKSGNAYFLTTPRGRNWIYDIYCKGEREEDDYKSFTAPTWANPYIPKSEILKAKSDYPELLFRQEFMAEFIIDAANVFQGVTNVAAYPILEPYLNGRFVMGVDLARKNDYTVIVIFDAIERQQVYLEIIGDLDWDVQRKKILKAYQDWRPFLALVEENNVGDVICQDLNKMGMKAKPFYTTSKNKNPIIEQLAMDIKNKNIKLINNRKLVEEFQAYQMKITENGTIKYAAPSGFHDDIVMATAIAWSGISKGKSLNGGLLRIYNGWSR